MKEDALLYHPECQCKVFVCAVSRSNFQQVARLASYETERSNTDRLKGLKIWQTARATSAAEEQHQLFSTSHRDLCDPYRYYRLNVANGLEDVGLEETHKKRDIATITSDYLEEEEQMKLIRSSIANLAEHESMSEFR